MSTCLAAVRHAASMNTGNKQQTGWPTPLQKYKQMNLEGGGELTTLNQSVIQQKSEHR